MSRTEPQQTQRGAVVARRIVFHAILLAMLALSCGTYWYSRYIVSPGPHADAPEETVVIARGSSVVAIKDILVEKKIIHDDIRFLLLARFEGYANRLQAGEFLLPTGALPLEILEILSSARSVQYRITIPEGLRAREIAQVFAAEGWCDGERFNRLVTDATFIARFDLPSITSLEGFLYPDTYFLTRDVRGAESIITLMVSRFIEVWQGLVKDLDQTPDLFDTLILASIVEKETGAPEERGLIAGVFHNRLRKKMLLQSDPTVIYGIKDFEGNITRKHLRTVTPYNTYKIRGLPVGPICNPGKDALKAVIAPVATKYLYFVSKNDGTHQFSRTLSEHNWAVTKYQRKKSRKKGK